MVRARTGPHLTESDRRVLTAWIRAGKTPQRVARRGRIVLLAAEGHSIRDVAARLGVSTRSVALWKRRFEERGPAALLNDKAGRGRKVTVTGYVRERLRALLTTPPPRHRWTVRGLAALLGISAASVHRMLKTDKLMLDSKVRGVDPRSRTAPFDDGRRESHEGEDVVN